MNELLAYEQQVGTVIEGDGLEKHLTQMRLNDILHVYDSTNGSESDLLNDIRNARKEITITIPDGSLDYFENEKLIHEIELAKQHNLLVRIAVRNYDALPEIWKYHCIRNDEVILPLVLIDRRIVWYGTPKTKASFIDKNMTFPTSKSYAVRFVGMHVAEMVSSFCSIERLMSQYKKPVAQREGGLKGKYQRVEQKKDGEKNSESKTIFHQSIPYEQPTKETGLKLFIQSRYRCRICKSPMKLLRGKSGKCYLQCSVCDHRDYLRVDTINDYIYRENVRCKEHNCRLEGKLGPDGVYVECERGHQIKPDEI